MNAALPDVSSSESSPNLSPLQWVGMQGIDLPITVAEPGCRRELHARADVQVDLPAAHVKGIHMSRCTGCWTDWARDRTCRRLACGNCWTPWWTATATANRAVPGCD